VYYLSNPEILLDTTATMPTPHQSQSSTTPTSKTYVSRLVRRLRQFLTTPTEKTHSSLLIFWLSLSLTIAAIFGFLGLWEAFSSEYVVQDDARQHLSWMRQFIDPALFPHDWIADYFLSVQPWGAHALYQLFASVGIDPIFLSKLLPIVLGLITTSYCFGICMEILPVPAAGFIATLLLNENIWMKDDLISATPRAFVYPLLLAFLYYLLRSSLVPCLVAIALSGLFYPSLVFIYAGILILGLWRWENRGLRLSQERSDYLFCATGLGVALLVMLPYALIVPKFGSLISAAAARTVSEFAQEGRVPFFHDNPWKFWLCGSYSGILPVEWCQLASQYSPRFVLMPPQIWVGSLLPILLRYPSRFPLARHVSSRVTLLLQLILASLGLFFVAHALLFRIYLPQRYTEHSLRIVMALAAGMVLTVILDGIFHCAQAKPHIYRQQFLALGSTALLGAALLLYPGFVKSKGFPFPNTQYMVGEVPALYKFFAQQPKDILIASLAPEADNLPTFSQRSILVSREFAIPLHPKYYAQIRQRAIDLLDAQYSPALSQVQSFIQKYGVDFWLLERAAFRPEYVANNPWFTQFQPTAAETVARLEQGTIPALQRIIQQCSVFEIENFVVLQATCITKLPRE
jgi:hypothetical protein